MPNVFICPVAEVKALLDKLPALIESETCHVIDRDELLSGNEVVNLIEKGVAACDVIVFIVEQGTLGPTAARAHELARLSGKKVVGVWTPANGAEVIPTTLMNYCHSWVPFERGPIQDNVCGSETDWLGIGGSHRPVQDLKRHKCRPKRSKSDAA